jgi:hypothetical protein
MVKKTLIILAILTLTLSSCQLFDFLKMFNASVNISSRTPGSQTKSLASRSLDTNGTINGDYKVYFRSSHISFWAIPTIEEVGQMGKEGYRDVIVEFGDKADSFLFIPGEKYVYETGRTGQFDGSKIYNMIRLDLGGGVIYFEVNGTVITRQELYTNSLWLIDKNYLSEPYYISSSNWNDDYINNPENAVPEVVKQICMDTSLDGSGGMFYPFEPVDFTQYEEITNVTIDFLWDSENSITYDEVTERYSQVDRVFGTCFDFQIQILINQ